MYTSIEYSNYLNTPQSPQYKYTFSLWQSSSSSGAIDPKVYRVKNVRLTLSKIKTSSASSAVTIRFNGMSVTQTIGVVNTTQVTLSGSQFDSLFAGVLNNQTADIEASMSSDEYAIRVGCTALLSCELEQNFSGSTFTVDTHAAIGSPAVFTITNPSMQSIAELKHVITISIPNTSYIASMELPAGYVTPSSNVAYFTIPTSWMPVLSNRVQVVANTQMQTFVGNSTTPISTQGPGQLVITAPESYKPSITQMTTSMTVSTATADGRIVSGWGVWLQGYSVISFTIHAAKSQDGNAEIRSYRVTCGDEVITVESTALTQTLTMSAPINVSGDISYTAVVTDARGRTASMTSTFNVLPYAIPTIRAAREPYRCNNTGVGSDEGAYCGCAFDGVVSDCGGNNTMTLQIGLSASDIGDIPIVDNDVAANTLTIVGGSLDKEIGYFVYYIVEDALGKKAAVRYDLATEPYAIHVKNGGRGVAFGMVAQNEQCVQINKNWQFRLKGKPIEDLFVAKDEDAIVNAAIHDGDGNKISDTYLKKTGMQFKTLDTAGQNLTVGAYGQVDVTLTDSTVSSSDGVFVTGLLFYTSNAVAMWLENPPVVWRGSNRVEFQMTVHNSSGVTQPVYLRVYYTVIV